MAGTVLYRTWRPRRFAEIVGQKPIVRTLKNAVAQEKVAHAYLFCGPRGTGKTSTGRILAKAINTAHDDEGESLPDDEEARAFDEGRALDLVEIDAASNRGIDNIRELRERANYVPTSSRYKVYLIDEVHQLTDAAVDALLKTLEEPPPHVVFILATTEPEALKPTIISRCQRFDFRRRERGRHRRPPAADRRRRRHHDPRRGAQSDRPRGDRLRARRHQSAGIRCGRPTATRYRWRRRWRRSA